MEAPHVEQFVHDDLKNIREGMHLRWNPKAVVDKVGRFDVLGKAKGVEWGARFEVWDYDPEGGEYMVMRCQTVDEQFRLPEQWLLDHLWSVHPDRFGGSVEKMTAAIVDAANDMQENMCTKDSDDLIEAAGNWGQWVATPKSGAALKYRGKRLLSA